MDIAVALELVRRGCSSLSRMLTRLRLAWHKTSLVSCTVKIVRPLSLYGPLYVRACRFADSLVARAQWKRLYSDREIERGSVSYWKCSCP